MQPSALPLTEKQRREEVSRIHNACHIITYLLRSFKSEASDLEDPAFLYLVTDLPTALTEWRRTNNYFALGDQVHDFYREFLAEARKPTPQDFSLSSGGAECKKSMNLYLWDLTTHFPPPRWPEQRPLRGPDL